MLFLIDDRVPNEPRDRSGWRDDVPWRGLAAVGLILVLCILGSTLSPAEGLACVVIATVIACRFAVRLGGDWRGMKDHRQ